MDNHDYIEINRMLMRQNESMINALVEVVKVLAPVKTPFSATVTPMFGANNPLFDFHSKDKTDMLKNFVDEQGRFDPFKNLPEEERNMYKEIIKKTPEILDTLKRKDAEEEERNKEWKEKLKGNGKK